MDIQAAKERNYQELTQKLKEFNSEYTVEDLLEKFKTVYMSNEPDMRRIRLLGLLKLDDDKQKRIQFFVLKRFEYERLLKEDVAELNTIQTSLKIFLGLYRQLVLLKEFEEIEAAFSMPFYAEFLSFNSPS